MINKKRVYLSLTGGGNPNSYDMKNKLFYEAPEAELLLLRFEENIMSVKEYGGFRDVEEEDWDKEV